MLQKESVKKRRNTDNTCSCGNKMLQNIDLYKSEDLNIAMLQKVSVKKRRNTDTQKIMENYKENKAVL